MASISSPFFRLPDGSLLEQHDVIGIFDLDTATMAKETRRFLRLSEAAGRVRVAARDIPDAFIVTDDGVFLGELFLKSSPRPPQKFS